MLESNEQKPLRWEELFSSSIKSSEDLSQYLNTPIPTVNYPILIPKSFARKIRSQGPRGPLWKQFIPSLQEDEDHPLGLQDPIADRQYAKDGGIIHRYKNRVLFSPTEVCPIQCRYCFRKNELHIGDPAFKANIKKLVTYLRENPSVEEVIFTGGDPLILSDARLKTLLEQVSSVKTVEMIRFHSRTPIILPQRLSPDLLKVLSSFRERFCAITIVVHANHESELDQELATRVPPFIANGISFLSQSVLLRGVNDCSVDLKKLFKKLYSINIKPYYLHHPDPVAGAMHFMIPLAEGREIYRKLKREVSGVMLPHYIIELPNGGGKSLAHAAQSEMSDNWYDKNDKIIGNVFP